MHDGEHILIEIFCCSFGRRGGRGICLLLFVFGLANHEEGEREM